MKKPPVPDTSLPQHVGRQGSSPAYRPHQCAFQTTNAPFKQRGSNASVGSTISQPSMTLLVSHGRIADFTILPSFLENGLSGPYSRTRSDSTSRVPFLKIPKSSIQ
jgi:hypothetical protein